LETFDNHDVAVVGAGVIGLTVAWRARQAGLSVVVIDRDAPGRGTSDAAAGMLAPVSEADPAEAVLLELLLRSAAAWPAFAAELQAASEVEVTLRDDGTLFVARDRDGAEAIDREIEIRARLGFEVQRLLPTQARALEPALAPTVRLAASLPGDHSVQPREVVRALIAACERAGVKFVRAQVDDPSSLRSARVVIATGAWSPAPVRPVKGQALLLRDKAGAALVQRVLRFEGGYLVPRGADRYYLGATVEEQGFDTAPTALGVYELLRDCAEVLPGVLELEIEELICGLRPGTPDNAPIIGPDPHDARVVWATGHYRHGVLLAPVTAELVVAELTGSPEAHDFGPQRFAEVVA
jgi:glycine oxidase